MGQYYVIKDVKKGNEWQNSYGTFQSYSLSLEGLGEPVSLNKTVPVKEEPEIGQKLYGTVEMLQSQKGTTYYKFKTEKVPDGEYTAPSPQNSPDRPYVAHHDDKEDSIARAVALKAAILTPWANPETIYELADKHLAWLKNEKPGESRTAASGYDTAKQARNRIVAGEPLPEPPEDIQELMDFANNDDIEGSWKE